MGAKFAVYWPGSLGYYIQGAVEETQTLRWYAEGLNAACEADIEVARRLGCTKVNIDTDLRLALTSAIRKVFAENPKEFDPRKYLKPAMEAMTRLCKQRLQQFNTAGQAGKIKKVLATSEMAKRYSKGELDPKVA